MPLKKGGFDQLYNLQALACRGPVIAAIATHDSTADTYALHPLLAAGAANLPPPGSADTIGKRCSTPGTQPRPTSPPPATAELYVAVTRESVQAGEQRGGTAPLCGQPGWQAMAAKLDTPEGRAVYQQRKAIIEPVFAQLFARFGRTLHYRGVMVTTEIHLWAAVHNLLKAIRARTRREQRDARPPPCPPWQPHSAATARQHRASAASRKPQVMTLPTLPHRGCIVNPIRQPQREPTPRRLQPPGHRQVMRHALLRTGHGGRIMACSLKGRCSILVRWNISPNGWPRCPGWWR